MKIRHLIIAIYLGWNVNIQLHRNVIIYKILRYPCKLFYVFNGACCLRIISSGVDICGIETCEILYPFSKLNIWAANYRPEEKRDVSTHGIFAFMRAFEPREMVEHNLLWFQIHNNFNHLDKLLLDVKCYKFVDICTHATKWNPTYLGNFWADGYKLDIITRICFAMIIW